MSDETGPLLSAIAGRLPYDRGDELLSLTEHGETALAIEMVLENLCEFEVPVSEAERALLRRLAVENQLHERVLAWLEELPPSD